MRLHQLLGEYHNGGFGGEACKSTYCLMLGKSATKTMLRRPEMRFAGTLCSPMTTKDMGCKCKPTVGVGLWGKSRSGLLRIKQAITSKQAPQGLAFFGKAQIGVIYNGRFFLMDLRWMLGTDWLTFLLTEILWPMLPFAFLRLL
jgi:hypothetical protein